MIIFLQKVKKQCHNVKRSGIVNESGSPTDL